MKIAIVFLLVGLSCSFASAGLLPCTGKLTKAEAEAAVQAYVHFIAGYQKVKDMGAENSPTNLPVKICLVTDLFDLVKTLAAFLDCDPNLVFAELLNCFTEIDDQTKAVLKTCFANNNYAGAAQLVIPIKVLSDATACLMDKIYKEHGFDLIEIRNTAISSALYAVRGLTAILRKNIASALGTKVGSDGLLQPLVNTVNTAVNDVKDLGVYLLRSRF
ncbi:uncharacterized protein LOC134965289 [Pseudophryne corroboree]|uniref:uncharacterized protein LOC134965289 n=1 Tax=Pseudophryne corroboree TaxID=495146 RepID=UPI0030819A51